MGAGIGLAKSSAPGTAVQLSTVGPTWRTAWPMNGAMVCIWRRAAIRTIGRLTTRVTTAARAARAARPAFTAGASIQHTSCSPRLSKTRRPATGRQRTSTDARSNASVVTRSPKRTPIGNRTDRGLADAARPASAHVGVLVSAPPELAMPQPSRPSPRLTRLIVGASSLLDIKPPDSRRCSGRTPHVSRSGHALAPSIMSFLSHCWRTSCGASATIAYTQSATLPTGSRGSIPARVSFPRMYGESGWVPTVSDARTLTVP